MRFGKDVLLEIVAIVQDGLVNGTDVSEKLRQIDVQVMIDDQTTEYLSLSDEYKNLK